MRFKKFDGDIDTVDYEDLDNYDDNYNFADDDTHRKIGSIRVWYYYKPIRTDDGFVGRRNNYIEYKSKVDRCENLSPKEHLNMIRPYLRDLVNEHKPIDEPNDDDDDDDTDRAEWKIQLSMQNSCISTRNFLRKLAPYIQKKNQ